MEVPGENERMTPGPEQKPSPKGAKWARLLQIVAILLFLVFVFSGVRIIQPGEAGVLLRFGKLPSRVTAAHPPGLLIAFPYPIDEVIRVPVESIRQITILDYWQPDISGTSVSSFHPLEQSYCITGDFNVVLPRLIVKYRINDPIAYALAVADPEKILRDSVGAELVRTIGEMEVDYILTEGKSVLAMTVKNRSQERLDAVGAGLRIVSIEINELIPPRSILPDFQAVQSAAIEKETVIRNAQTYQAQRIPEAEAEATQIKTQAEGYSVTTLARANADANAFVELLEEYRRNPDVVRERLLNESLARALSQAGSRYVAPGPPISGRLLIPPAYGL